MMQFKGFKPEAMKKIQGSLGFQGYAEEFDKYLEDNPDKKAMMDNYKQKAIEMMNGGIVLGYANGGNVDASMTPTFPYNPTPPPGGYPKLTPPPDAPICMRSG